MPMTLAEYKRKFPDRPDPIPSEFAGQWIAWNQERTQIVAHGKDCHEVYDRAIARGCSRPIMHFFHPAPFIGRA